MKRIFLLMCNIVLVTVSAFGQNITVMTNDGASEQIDLSDIENITFDIAEGVLQSFSAADNMLIHTATAVHQLLISDIDSLYFNDDGSIGYFQTSAGLSQFTLAEIDSITFSSGLDSTVYITFGDTAISVVNPLALLGVSVEIDSTGSDVIVTSTSTIEEIDYVLSGTTGDGMFKIYSDEKVNLHLNNVQITNLDGPAINVQSDRKITVFLEDGTNNSLTDGAVYADPPNNEDQDAAFFSEGQLIFTGSGNLTINGNGEDEHGLRSDDYIEINDGNLTVTSATKDAIHTNDGFYMTGGTVNLTSEGDGVDGGDSVVDISGGNLVILNTEDDNDAIKCDSTIGISDGTVTITVEGDQSKGLNSEQSIMLSGGILSITTTGGVVLEASGSGFDPSYCTAIKTDEDVIIDSCTVIINTSGPAGRGISCDGDVIITAGTLNITSSGDGDSYINEDGEPDAYHGPCINADANIEITGGVITLSHSGDGGKGISNDEDITIGGGSMVPIINVTTTGQSITISGGPNGESAEAKGISADSAITIFNGEITVSSADDGIKSKKSIIIDGGVVTVTNSYEGIESPELIINGGEISVNSSDDGLNATMGGDSHSPDGSILSINGGYVHVSASGGDAIDSNGDFFVNGGTMVFHGPPSSPEVGIDINGDFVVTGGLMVASGTNSNMTQAPISSSTQNSVLLRTNTSIPAGTLFHLQDASGTDLLTFAPERRYYSIVFSSPDLSSGITYSIYTGGSSTGTIVNGLYSGGTYSGGTLRTSFTLSNISQTVFF